MKDHVTPHQVAQMCDINQQEVYRAIHRGELPAVRRRGYKGRMGRIRIRKEDAHEFFQAAFVAFGSSTDDK